MDVCRIGDEVRQQPVLVRLRAEEVRVVAGDAVECGCLLVGEGQGFSRGLVAVGPEILDYGGVRIANSLRAELCLDVVAGAAQIIGGVVGAEVRAVPDHGPVFVQTACLI